MKGPSVAAFLLIAAGSLFAAEAGKVTGTFVIGQERKALTHAYVVEKGTLLKIVLATGPLEEEALFDNSVLRAAVAGGAVSAVVVRLDDDRRADSAFFFDAELPAGLEVREINTFKMREVRGRNLAGRVVMKDDGFSFSYDATFEAPLTSQIETVVPLSADATPAEHALARIREMEIPFNAESFSHAIREGDVETVTLFLTAGMPVETDDGLSDAVESGQAAVAKLLIEHGADVNRKDEYDQSLVLVVVGTKNLAMLELLIAAGADVSVPNKYRVTPLASATTDGQLEVVKALLAAGAKVNARNTSGGTALSSAVFYGHKEIVEALLAAKADVQRDKDDLLAFAADKPEIKAMLVKAMAAK